jgi:hypothetical protein
MTEWALMHRGRVVNVVTTNKTKDEVQDGHPTYTVTDLHSLPDDVVRRWNERP